MSIGSVLLEVAKSSPLLAIMLLFWFYSRQDYQNFVNKVQDENSKRETNYQETIKKLTDNLNTIQEVKQDVEEIKYKIK